MCGRFNLIDSPEVQKLCKTLGIDLPENATQSDIAPGGQIKIIHRSEGARRMSDAIWWLLLDGKTLKPNYRYASFNSRSEKLFTENSISYKPFRESRCIIPCSAFIEGLGDKKTYHKVELENSAIAFGGLYKEYLNQITGEIVHSASIITLLPSSHQWDKIHPKSMPLMIDFSDNRSVAQWLDSGFTSVSELRALLSSTGKRPMRVTPIGRPSQWNVIGDSFSILA